MTLAERLIGGSETNGSRHSLGKIPAAKIANVETAVTLDLVDLKYGYATKHSHRYHLNMT